jgi:gamma-glutamyltranspeptidase
MPLVSVYRPTLSQEIRAKSIAKFISKKASQLKQWTNCAVFPSSTHAYVILCGLVAMGHETHRITGWQRGVFGRGQIIKNCVDPSGRRVWAGGSDPRADGHVVAQI